MFQALRRATPALGLRRLTTSAAARGGGGAHEPDYIHAPSMYNLPAMTNRKLKFGLGVAGVVLGGSAIPFIAASHQQKKARG